MLTIKVGDLTPNLVVDTNADLTGVTSPEIRYRRYGTTTWTTKTATVTSPATGVLTYVWQTGDTDTAGTYVVEGRATFAGKRQTFPQDSDLEMRILP